MAQHEFEAVPIRPEFIRRQIDLILQSADFHASERRRILLRYLAEETLAGRMDRLKGYSIAIAVFKRPESFDPQADPIVRVEAGRLRKDLEHYYLTAGYHDSIRIGLPKGHYSLEARRRNGDGRDQVEAVPDDDRSDISDSSHGPTPAGAARPRKRRPHLIAILAAALVLAGVGFPFLYNAAIGSGEQTPVTTSAAPQSGFSIAVLPFGVGSGTSENRYFAEGMSKELANSLSRLPDLAVVPPTSIKLDESVDPVDFMKSLEVGYAVDGTVEKGADEIHVTVRLLDARTGGLLWAEEYRRTLQADKLFDIRNDLTQRVAVAVGGRGGIIAQKAFQNSLRKPAAQFDSFDCVLRFYNHLISMRAETHLKVRECLELAVVRDPDYAKAWSSLSQIYAQQYRLGLNPRETGNLAHTRDLALAAARRGMELNPFDPLNQLILACAYYDADDMVAFRQTADEALRLSPRDPDILAGVGLRLAFSGDWDRGLPMVQTAIDLSPHHPGWYHTAFAVHEYLQGDYESALAEASQVSLGGLFRYEFFAAMIYGESGQTEKARDAATRLVEQYPQAAAMFWPTIRAWNFPTATIDRFADGLQKAGLPISPTNGVVTQAP
jgi:adenylate cyclase